MKYSLINHKNCYKGNMHCHSTMSDGMLSVEELAAAYKKHGYSFVCFSDHDEFYKHNDLTSEDFIAINSYEQNFPEGKSDWYGAGKCYHLNFYAKTPEQEAPFIPPRPAYTDMEGINNFIRYIKSQGYLCSYNHPYWSMQNYSDYINLENIDFVEVYNHGCYVEGWHENQINVYDDMVRWGKNRSLFCNMTDDNHNRRPIEAHLTDSFGGCVWVRADKLDYTSIIAALEKGDFYCSAGPVIKELTYDSETKNVTVKTSPAFSVTYSIIGRKCRRVQAENGNLIEEAVFTVGDNDIGFRIEVTDTQNRRADTNFYWLKDLANKE